MKKLCDVECVRNAEKALIDGGETVVSLMKRAGDGLYEKLKKTNYDKVYIFVGKGNNGGDGFAIACNFLQAKRRVTVVTVSDEISGAAAHYRDIFKAGGGRVSVFSDDLDIKNSLIVDCIFGVGFHGEVTGVEKRAICLIDKLRANGNHVVSVDIPSGSNGNNGLGDTVVKADETYAVGCLKTGLVLNAAKDRVGEISVVDIGLDPEPVTAYLVEATDLKPVLRERKGFSHKNDYGTVGVFGGSVNYGGAAKLANLSLCALQSGAGISRLIVPEVLTCGVMPYLLESTLATVSSDKVGVVFDKQSVDKAIKGLSALSVGMGMGNTDETYKTIEYLINNTDIKLCVDADGLNALSKNVALLKKKRSFKTVLTPHVGEFCRLSGASAQEVLSDRIGHAKAFAKENNVILLLKGTATVITDGETVLVTDRGTAGMATAGSGDILSGVIAGLLGYNEPDVSTVAAASYIVGYAAELAENEVCDISYTSSVTAKYIPAAITAIYDKIHDKKP